jgi:glycosyltransferase involved in cell wall biosynthesis
VVAFDHAAAGQLIRHGDNGWLAAPQEPVQFVELAARAAGDRDALRTMGMRARDTALSLDWQRVVNDLEAVLRRAAAPVESAQSPLLLRPLST